uniref:Ubiquitin carboxyl-terminal hydrolase n=1 Tax=Cyprinus carpio TaxID=7962 RepID=A0A8C1GR89_CYPCA
MEGQRWLPLEANPEFLRQLGLVPTWQFGDVYGLDAEVLSLVPRPVCAVLLLFPITEKYETFRQEEEAKIKAQGQELSSDVYFMKQTIGNACGTIGLIHAVANNQRYLEFEPNSPLKAFLLKSAKMSPEEKAAFLEKDESIRVTHESSAQEGQTEAPSLDEKVDLHFIAFVNVEGHLYELGRHPKLPTHWFLVLPVFVLVSQAVTKKKFWNSNFRSSLENGLLLCDLINKIRPGVIKKLNRLATPIAGLDNINLFLKACAKLGLKEAQLFHPGDLQDLSTRVTVKPQESSRRLKNVLITIYWLGRKAHSDPFYNGPYLKLKAFEGLLGTALYKALEDCTSLRGSVRNSSCRDNWYSEKEELFPLRAGHRREDSLDSLDSLGSRTYSTSSDTTLKGNSEGKTFQSLKSLFYLSFMMSEYKEYRRSQVIAPKTPTQFNQFLPTKEKQSGYVPAPLRKKRADRNDDDRRSWASPMYTEDDGIYKCSQCLNAGAYFSHYFLVLCFYDRHWWSVPVMRGPVSTGVCIYDDSEEEDDEFGYADPVQDDLYARKVGLRPQPSVTVPSDKFLPKFWTPEEDAHVKKIKLGSQRRPWYRKIQGFRSVQY